MDQSTNHLWSFATVVAVAFLVGPTFPQIEHPAQITPEPSPNGAAIAQDIPRTIDNIVNMLNRQANSPSRRQPSPNGTVNLPPLDPKRIELVGIQPGMSLSQAKTIIASKGGFRISRKDLLAQHVNGENIPELRIWAEKGANWPARSEKILVSLMGSPGQERVTKIERQVSFSRDRRPTMDDVEDEIVRKFGPPSSTYASGAHSWAEYVFYPDGRRIPKSGWNDSDYDRCNTPHWLFGERTVPPKTPCGYYVVYDIGKESGLNNNAARYSVTVIDQVRSRILSDQYLQSLRANPKLKDQVDLGL